MIARDQQSILSTKGAPPSKSMPGRTPLPFNAFRRTGLEFERRRRRARERWSSRRPPDSDVDKAWHQEIVRRLSEIDAGTAKLVDREEFCR